MTRVSYCLFETSLGPCGIAWTASDNPSAPPAVTFFQLPEASARLTEARMAHLAGTREPSEPPPLIADVIEKVRLHLEGTAQDFSAVPLNLEGVGPFARAVYDIARNIPAGETRTYGEIAKSLNQPAAARAVGQALGRNPIPLLIPCHRVVAAGGKTGGFSAPGGKFTKVNILALEGVRVESQAAAKSQRSLWEVTAR